MKAEHKDEAVNWDAVHRGTENIKRAFLGFDLSDSGPKRPKWMDSDWLNDERSPTAPSWMVGMGDSGTLTSKPGRWRDTILSWLLGIQPQALQDTRSVMGGVSGIMDFFRNLGSAFKPSQGHMFRDPTGR